MAPPMLSSVLGGSHASTCSLISLVACGARAAASARSAASCTLLRRPCSALASTESASGVNELRSAILRLAAVCLDPAETGVGDGGVDRAGRALRRAGAERKAGSKQSN